MQVLNTLVFCSYTYTAPSLILKIYKKKLFIRKKYFYTTSPYLLSINITANSKFGYFTLHNWYRGKVGADYPDGDIPKENTDDHHYNMF